MSSLLFWFFSLLTLGFACLVVFNRNPVASALSLVVSLLGLAALFTLLDAYFIGIIQVLVYGGAVMVLFLFIIMLLDLRTEKRRKFNLLATIGGGAVMLGFIGQIFAVLKAFPAGDQPFPALLAPLEDVHNIGTLLFTSYNLPFQVIGVVVLVATIGVVILSKRELR